MSLHVVLLLRTGVGVAIGERWNVKQNVPATILSKIVKAAVAVKRTGREAAMTDNGGNLNFGKNRYIFAGAGAVLGGLLGVGIAGVTTALVGAALGGLLGYNLLKRI
jgi:hypothetical protein